MTDNRTAVKLANGQAIEALERVMAVLDAARIDPSSPSVQQFVSLIDTDVQAAREAMSTVRYGYELEAQLCDQLAEALRLTAEWSQAIALPGWSWFDALTAYHNHREWDVLPATGLPAGISEEEAAEPVWSIGRIRATLDDPFTAAHDRDKAMRMLRWYERREHEVPETAAAEAPAPQPPIPELGEERGAIRGVPFLLEQLALLAKDSVYLWHSPERSQPWCIWTGPPAGTSGGQWGAGATAAEALADAYRNVTSAIFDGRVVR